MPDRKHSPRQPAELRLLELFGRVNRLAQLTPFRCVFNCSFNDSEEQGGEWSGWTRSGRYAGLISGRTVRPKGISRDLDISE